MRLIDSDLVLDKMRNTFDMQDLYLPIHFKELIIDDLPTVKAIPLDRVEQIREEISKMQTYLCFHGDTKKVELSDVLDMIDKAIKEVEQ